MEAVQENYKRVSEDILSQEERDCLVEESLKRMRMLQSLAVFYDLDNHVKGYYVRVYHYETDKEVEEFEKSEKSVGEFFAQYLPKDAVITDWAGQSFSGSGFRDYFHFYPERIEECLVRYTRKRTRTLETDLFTDIKANEVLSFFSKDIRPLSSGDQADIVPLTIEDYLGFPLPIRKQDSVGAYIARVMLREGITTEDLAKKSGMSKEQVEDYLDGSLVFNQISSTSCRYPEPLMKAMDDLSPMLNDRAFFDYYLRRQDLPMREPIYFVSFRDVMWDHGLE